MTTRKNAFGFPTTSTPPVAKRAAGKAAVQNVKLRVAAATRAAGEVTEAMRRGDVELEDFAEDWEGELEPGRKRR